MKPTISSLNEIQLLVDTFYGKVRSDEILAPIFDSKIKDKWPEHLDKMYRFWQTVLLNERTYQGSPLLPHIELEIEEIHFHRWLQLFRETVEGNFSGETAQEAIYRSQKIAEMFSLKLTNYKRRYET
jgi:hemoglobin